MNRRAFLIASLLAPAVLRAPPVPPATAGAARLPYNTPVRYLYAGEAAVEHVFDRRLGNLHKRIAPAAR